MTGSPCDEWVGRVQSAGYGVIYRPVSRYGRGDGKLLLVHRVVYEEEVGPIPPGMQVHHTCHNKLCINPDHLELVDPAEHAGAAGGNGKLTRRMAEQIKSLLAGGWQGIDIAAAFGCSPQQVCNIKHGRSWA